MAETNGSPTPEIDAEKASPEDLWAQAAGLCKFSVVDNVPMIGVSGDKSGFIVKMLPVPAGFAGIADQGSRCNAFRAYQGHALRVGQQKLKSADAESIEVAQAGVSSALDGTYKPQRETDSDIVYSEAFTKFRDETVKPLVLAKKADATESDFEASALAAKDTPNGIAKMAALMAEIVKRGTYTVTRKTRGSAAITIEVPV